MKALQAEMPHKPAHPLVFLILILPFGVVGGFVTVTFAYLYNKAGVSDVAIAALIGSSLLPNVIKFLWAPLVDITLSLKKWYVLSGILTAIGLLIMGFMPIAAKSLPVLTVINVITNITVSLLAMTVSGLVAHDVPHELKGRVSGYIQAGNLGGSGLGGGLGLWLAQHSGLAWLPGAALAVACMLCCIALLFVKEHNTGIRERQVLKTMANLWRDIWHIIKARAGILALILCFLPLGTGSAANLFAAEARHWKASADTVAIITGTLGAVITAIGCFVGGYICDITNRQKAYVAFGLLQAACAVGMAYSPHTEYMYIFWTSTYAITNGLCYAAFSAFVLDVIGKGAAGTKFTVYSSLSNAPIYYMTLLEGSQATNHGIESMLTLEAIVAVGAAIGFIILIRVLMHNKRKEGVVTGL